MDVSTLFRRTRAIGPYWRSIRASERAAYDEAIKLYEEYRERFGQELPSDRAFYAKLLILNRRYDDGVAYLQSLIADIDSTDADLNGLTGYVYAYSRMVLAGMNGEASRDYFRKLAISKNPPRWLSKLLPTGN